ncbi:putative tetratricopeptide-like helical domain superfamily, DYW domain-containing protein [Dioscorea sansibarensis]
MSVMSVPLSCISISDKCNAMPELRQVHAHLIKSNLISSSSALSAKPLAFHSIVRSLSSQSENHHLSLVLYSKILSFLDDLHGIEFLLPSVLKVCGILLAFNEGRQIHGQILKGCLQDDPFVANSLLRMYLDWGQLELAGQLFDKMPNRDVISWNSMITGCVKVGDISLARKLFDEMPDKDVISCNSMIDGLMKSGMCEDAEDLFECMNVRDVVSWTAMISGYVHNHRPNAALELFRRMLNCSVQPDVVALVNVLSAIAELGFPDKGRWIHAYIHRSNIKLSSGNIGSALIDMYFKCGLVSNAYSAFERLCGGSEDGGARRTGNWNAMISGLAIHGLGKEAIEIFNDMEKKKVNPDDITFLGLLNACSHSGLVDESQHYFSVMCKKHNLKPSIKHYGCLIDLYSRAGQFETTKKIIEDMPMKPDATAWKSILSACVKHNYVTMGEYAAMKVTELAPNDSSCYVLLSNLYAKSGSWTDVERVRKLMKDRGIRKVPGCSSMVIKGKVHEFLVGKEMGVGRRAVIVSKLKEVIHRLKLLGYEPDVTQVLVDAEDEEKESLLSVHSEKMAIAFGLINSEKGEPMHIVKNLRVCSDCHSFSKLVSGVYEHEIILRDQNRFHHFREGSCSCNDYW